MLYDVYRNIPTMKLYIFFLCSSFIYKKLENIYFRNIYNRNNVFYLNKILLLIFLFFLQIFSLWMLKIFNTSGSTISVSYSHSLTRSSILITENFCETFGYIFLITVYSFSQAHCFVHAVPVKHLKEIVSETLNPQI